MVLHILVVSRVLFHLLFVPSLDTSTFEFFISSRSKIGQLAEAKRPYPNIISLSTERRFYTAACTDGWIPPSPTVNSIVGQHRCFYGMFLLQIIVMRLDEN